MCELPESPTPVQACPLNPFQNVLFPPMKKITIKSKYCLDPHYVKTLESLEKLD